MCMRFITNQLDLMRWFPNAENDNALYIVAKLPLSHQLNVVTDSDADSQMQRELQWFKVSILHL